MEQNFLVATFLVFPGVFECHIFVQCSRGISKQLDPLAFRILVFFDVSNCHACAAIEVFFLLQILFVYAVKSIKLSPFQDRIHCCPIWP